MKKKIFVFAMVALMCVNSGNLTFATDLGDGTDVAATPAATEPDKSNDELHEKYLQFLRNKEYAPYEIEYENISGTMCFHKYAFSDLDFDGSDELILTEYNEDEMNGYGYSMFFTYSRINNLVEPITIGEPAGDIAYQQYYLRLWYGPFLNEKGYLEYVSGEGKSESFYQYNGKNICWIESTSIMWENGEEICRYESPSGTEDISLSAESANPSAEYGTSTNFDWVDIPDTGDLSYEEYNSKPVLSEIELYSIENTLGIPYGTDITYDIGDVYYWEAGGRSLFSISFYQNGNLVAGASCDADTFEPISEIMTYTEPLPSTQEEIEAYQYISSDDLNKEEYFAMNEENFRNTLAQTYNSCVQQLIIYCAFNDEESDGKVYWNIFYSILDIDVDGIPELIIHYSGYNSKYDFSLGVYQVFTFDEEGTLETPDPFSTKESIYYDKYNHGLMFLEDGEYAGGYTLEDGDLNAYEEGMVYYKESLELVNFTTAYSDN